MVEDRGAVGASATDYFRGWAESLDADGRSLEVTRDELRPLTKLEAVRSPEILDAGQLIAGGVAQSQALSEYLAAFTESEESARTKFGRIRELYGKVRRQIEESRDVVALMLRGQDLENDLGVQLEKRLYEYLIQGKTTTRLGEEIKAPAEDAQDKSFAMLLDLVRIVAEHEMDRHWELPWLADSQTDEARAYRELEKKAGQVGQDVGQVLGRTATVGALGLLGFALKPPNEVIVGVSHVTGLVVRKGAEKQMHVLLDTHGVF